MGNTEMVAVYADGLQRKMTWGKKIVLTYEIHFPQFASKMYGGCLQRINREVLRKAAEVQGYFERCLYPMAVRQYAEMTREGYPFNPYEGILEYTVTENQDSVLSWYYNLYEYTGGAHGQTIMTAENWDLMSCRKLSLGDVYACDPQYKADIIQEILEQIGTRSQEEGAGYFDNYEELVIQNYDDFNFYLTPDGAEVFFQQYAIAPYASGMPTFEIPYKCEK